MSARYIQSLRYHIQQCNWINDNIGTPDEAEDENCQDAIDFIDDLRLGYERQIEEVAAQMALIEAGPVHSPVGIAEALQRITEGEHILDVLEAPK